MGAPDLLQWFRRDGFALSLLPSGGLAVQPASKLTDSHRHALRTHKADLVAALTDDASLNPDRFCWPHSIAMNTAEIGTFTARVHQFIRYGLDSPEAEGLADRLVTRDRKHDDRRMCLECSHIRHAAGLWRCGQWRQAELSGPDVAGAVVTTLQRCAGFNDKVSISAKPRGDT